MEIVLFVSFAGLCTKESLNSKSNLLFPAPLYLDSTYFPESDMSLNAGLYVPDPGASVLDL